MDSLPEGVTHSPAPSCGPDLEHAVDDLLRSIDRRLSQIQDRLDEIMRSL